MRRRKDEAELTRTAILDAAEAVFVEQGFATATLEKISRAAGVTRGALYWHFKDKLDLLMALHQRNVLPQESLIEFAAEQGHDDPLALLLKVGGEVLELFESDESRQRMFIIMSLQPLGQDGANWLLEANTRMFNVLVRLVSRVKAAGGLNEEFTAEDAAMTMMVTMNGLLSEWLRSGKAFDLVAFGKKLFRNQLNLMRSSSGHRTRTISDSAP